MTFKGTTDTAAPAMAVELVSLFPEMFVTLSDFGVTGRAIKKGRVHLGFNNPRDFAQDVHRTVDDRPYGGGPGMVMMIEPLLAAVTQAKSRLQSKGVTAPKVIYVSPQGETFTQHKAQQLSETPGIVLVCGRYEGVDERFIEMAVDEEWSIGDYVASGGELPAMLMLDAAIRLVPGVLGHESSAVEDSFVDGLLDCPHYTRPETFAGVDVPKVLLSGHHGEIKRWRLQQALGRTYERRPDLFNRKALTREQEVLLEQYLDEHNSSQKD